MWFLLGDLWSEMSFKLRDRYRRARLWSLDIRAVSNSKGVGGNRYCGSGLYIIGSKKNGKKSLSVPCVRRAGRGFTQGTAFTMRRYVEIHDLRFVPVILPRLSITLFPYHLLCHGLTL